MFGSSNHWALSAYGAVAALLIATSANSAEYRCYVPRALLCDGCAEHIVVALQLGGNCRVSFTPPQSTAMSPFAKAEPDQLEVSVEAAPVRSRRTPRRRTVGSRQRPIVAAAKSMSTPRCFIFNGQKYCE